MIISIQQHIATSSYIIINIISKSLILLDLVSGKTVSFPPTAYVLERNEGRLQCQNRSEDNNLLYNYINDAIWYRLFSNDTIQQYGTSGPIYVQSNSLIFHPFVRPEDQGTYYCCKPGGSCSEHSTVSVVGMYVAMYINSLLAVHSP